MVTTLPLRSAGSSSLATSPLAFTWRFSEAFWPALPAACGLDADAARLLRAGLSLAVEQMLDRWRETGASLPAPCSLRRVRQRRFDATVAQGERRDELQALMQEEVRLTLALARRPLGGAYSAQWAPLLVEQCARIGALYQALARQVGRDLALSDLAVALERACLGYGSGSMLTSLLLVGT